MIGFSSTPDRSPRRDQLQVTALDADTAKSMLQVMLYVTAHQHDTGEQATAPPVIRSPSLPFTVPGELVRTEEG